jgi:hypothetical protein
LARNGYFRGLSHRTRRRDARRIGAEFTADVFFFGPSVLQRKLAVTNMDGSEKSSLS